MLKVYRDRIVGPAPAFSHQMEQRITRYLQGDASALVVDAAAGVVAPGAPRGEALSAAVERVLPRAMVFGPGPMTKSSSLNPIREN